MNSSSELTIVIINFQIYFFFNLLVEQIFEKDNQEGAKIWRFIDIKLKQFNLAQAYEPQEIFAIAYERSLKALREGKIIKSESIIPWFKSVSFNIIRELRKERDKEYVKRSDKPTEEIADQIRLQDSVSWEDNPYKVKYEKLISYLKTLSPLEQELFQLRMKQTLSWNQIFNKLTQEGFDISSEATLRKRFSRLKAKLKAHIQ